MYTNAQSIYHKLTELRQRSSKGTKLIALTETWLSPSISNSEVSIPDMNLFRVDRLNGRGGGVALYLHTSFKARLLPDPTLVDSHEILWCSVSLSSSNKWLIGVIYRPPNADQLYDSTLLGSLERMLASRYSRVLILGDFNLPQIDFTSNTFEGSEYSTAALLFHLICDHGFSEHVQQNTRWGVSGQASKLDYIFTNEDLMVDQVKTSAPLGLSDHAVLEFNFILHTYLQPPLNVRRRNFRRTNIPLLQNITASVDWTHLPELSLNEMCTMFQSRLTEAIGLSVPLSLPAPLREPRILRSCTLRSIRLKSTAWATFKCSGSSEDYNDYKVIRNKTTALIRADRSAYQHKLTERFMKDPKQLFRFVSSKRKAKAGISQLSGPSGPTNNDNDAAVVLAQHYYSVFTVNPGASHPQELSTLPSDQPPLSSVDTSPEATLRKLLSLKDTSPGSDAIPPSILIAAATQLALPLSLIFSASVATGSFPSAWKSANITPIYKGGDRGQPLNYRPIALLPSVSKVLEMLVHDSITTHLTSSQFLSVNQHGFRKGHSCFTNLLLATDEWTRAVDTHQPVDVIYFDFSKAFDRVHHQTLLQRLRQLHVVDPLLSWIQSYLQDRTFSVRVNQSFSPTLPSPSGVPQGSILGPLLFLIFINSAPSDISSSVKIFADDIKIWRTLHDIDDHATLQRDIDTLFRWSEVNLLPLNPLKCAHMPLRHSPQSTYTLNGVPIPVVSTQKDLGVLMSSSLSSSLHCAAIAKKASRNLGLLRRVFGKFDPNCFHKLFNAYVRPHLEFGTAICPPFLQKDKLMLERVQRRATKCVISLRNLPYEARLNSLSLFPLEYRRLRGDLILTYSIIQRPDHPCKSLLTPNMNPNLRGHSLRLAAQQSRLDCRYHSFSLRIVRFWNALPQAIVSASNINTFKLRLDAHLLGTS